MPPRLLLAAALFGLLATQLAAQEAAPEARSREEMQLLQRMHRQLLEIRDQQADLSARVQRLEAKGGSAGEPELGVVHERNPAFVRQQDEIFISRVRNDLVRLLERCQRWVVGLHRGAQLAQPGMLAADLSYLAGIREDLRIGHRFRQIVMACDDFPICPKQIAAHIDIPLSAGTQENKEPPGSHAGTRAVK